jgi:hypothetical protein
MQFRQRENLIDALTEIQVRARGGGPHACCGAALAMSVFVFAFVGFSVCGFECVCGCGFPCVGVGTLPWTCSPVAVLFNASFVSRVWFGSCSFSLLRHAPLVARGSHSRLHCARTRGRAVGRKRLGQGRVQGADGAAAAAAAARGAVRDVDRFGAPHAGAPPPLLIFVLVCAAYFLRSRAAAV